MLKVKRGEAESGAHPLILWLWFWSF